MDHQDPHGLAGEKVLLFLDRPDPLGIIYDREVAVVLDWQDRHLGRVWSDALRRTDHPLYLHYLGRMKGSGREQDPDVVAVRIDRSTWLVHQTELGTKV